jgi:uncharacterized protein
VHVAELWRHPVKSLQGESLAEATVEDDGMAGDRRFGIVDRETNVVLTAKRVPDLLRLRPHIRETGVAVALPDGDVLEAPGAPADDALSRFLDRPVTLVDARSFEPGKAEYYADAIDEQSDLISWRMPKGRFVDAFPLLIITTASLRAGRNLHPDGAWDVRRFRPNIVVDVDGDGWIEDAWCGRALRVGSTLLLPAVRCERCTLVTRAQPDFDRDLDIFKSLAHDHDKTFGVWTTVQTPGAVHVGDEVTLIE